jgi:uracil-DNA glycosylase family 4
MIKPYGDPKARIMLVGESPTRSEYYAGGIYHATSGKELTKMLHEAGILMTECYVTSVCRVPMPGTNTKMKYFSKMTKLYQIPKKEVTEGISKLKMEIEAVQPTLIIALGDLALYALTGELGITKWRGSILELGGTQMEMASPGTPLPCKVIPTYAPDIVCRKWDWRFITVQDLRRCKKEAAFPEVKVPPYEFIVRPDFKTVMETIGRLCHEADTHDVWGGFDGREGVSMGSKITPHNGATDASPLILTGDIETRLGHIACFGIGWSRHHAICIPFISINNIEGYWSYEEEFAIIQGLSKLFKHPRIGWVFQNGIYDFQYFAKWWGFIPRIYMDTMLAHHTLFAGLPKGLDFQSSIYCEYHRYWKDEGKEFHGGVKDSVEEDKYWVYNCKDCVTDFEIAEVLAASIPKMKATIPYEFQMKQFAPVLRLMLRGINMDGEKKLALMFELTDAIADRERYLTEVIGRYVNPKSHKQMKEFFYDELGLPPQKVRKTGKLTTNAEALETLAKKEPLIAPVIKVFSELRSLNVFLGTFIKAPLSEDGRMRSSYNIAGTETFRWSSSQDAFGAGMNLQNIPKGNE